jgi:hypothetical protein
VHHADALGFVDRFARPDTGVAVVRRLPVGEEVLRHHREVMRGARGDKQDREFVADVSYAPDRCFCAVEHAAEFFAAV